MFINGMKNKLFYATYLRNVCLNLCNNMIKCKISVMLCLINFVSNNVVAQIMRDFSVISYRIKTSIKVILKGIIFAKFCSFTCNLQNFHLHVH